MQRFGKHIPAEANALDKRRAVFSVVSAALVAKQLCGKQICAAVHQHSTIEDVCFLWGRPEAICPCELLLLEAGS
jgi:hypothetical protein